LISPKIEISPGIWSLDFLKASVSNPERMISPIFLSKSQEMPTKKAYLRIKFTHAKSFYKKLFPVKTTS
jgi:hypothetical protein